VFPLISQTATPTPTPGAASMLCSSTGDNAVAWLVRQRAIAHVHLA
jgi:hypothetical protein